MIGLGANHFEMNYGIPGVPPNADWLNVPPTTSRIAQRRTTVELRSLFNVGGSWLDRVRLDASYWSELFWDPHIHRDNHIPCIYPNQDTELAPGIW